MLRRLHHIGIVVGNLESAIEGFRGILGLHLNRIETLATPPLRIAFLQLDDTLVELIEPSGETGMNPEFLLRTGGGVHHLAFEVDDVAQGLAAVEAAGGSALRGGGIMPGAGNTRIVFLQPDRFGGALVELCQNLPAGVPPA